jgi:hypothetical protein
MKPALFICIKNPFTGRDLERMGIETLAAHFELRIIDCTAWLMPAARTTRGATVLTRPDLHAVRSLREFIAALGDARGGYAIDYVGPFSPSAILMFNALKARDIKLVVIDSGAYPPPEATLGKRSTLTKILDVFRHGGLRQHLYARINRILLNCLRDQRPDYALVAGSWWQADPRFAQAAHKIAAHSFDYERYWQVKRAASGTAPSVDGPFAVYLDEDIAGHEDNAEIGLANPAVAENFYPALARLFDRFEAATGMPVVIAGYPSNRSGATAHFGQRRVLYGRTAELIRDAKLVFAHASTAISFAVLWRRPLVFLTSEEIGKSWYQPWIEAPRALLGAPLANIDRPPDAMPPEWSAVNAPAYENYQATFIKTPGSPDISLWEIFLQIKQNEGLP